jgi:hypothetical protein
MRHHIIFLKNGSLDATRTNTQNFHINSMAFSPQANYRLSDRHLSAQLVPTLADRGCRVVSATDPPSR